MKLATLWIAVLGGTCSLAQAAQPKAPPSTAPATPITLAAPTLTPDQTAFFESKIRPLLTANCYKCHSVEQNKAKGNLTLDTREGLIKGGDTATAIIPGDPDNSLLIKAITYNDPDLQMPPKGENLSDKEIADLTTWVKMGAPDPRTAAAGAPKLTGLTDKARSHWAYQPVQNPPIPEVKNKAWQASPVDAFVMSKLEQNQLAPNPRATKEALIRRATYDLIGLPPTPEEVKAFVTDQSPTAFEKVVDRLLASPHYGERWGRFWLDSARYSDTSGNDKNNAKEDYRYAHAWTYRDYVINAFNTDKPYDQFLKEQIAADQLPAAKEDPSRLAALGFLTVGKRFANPNDTIDERIDALTKSTMAMTVACARCHDHKFDPIPTADYYSLHGIFSSTVEPAEKPLIGKTPSGPDYDDFRKKVAAIEDKNRNTYFDYIDAKSSEFRGKASAYLQAWLHYRKNDRDAIVERQKLITDFKLDRDLYQGGSAARAVRKDGSVFGPLIRFAELPADAYDTKAKQILDEIQAGRPAAGNRFARKPINARVVAAFKDVKPESLKSLKDVADIYGKLFVSIDADAKRYVAANRVAKEDVKGFDADLVELFEVPADISPAYTLNNDELKSLVQKLPQQNNNAYQRFSFSEINQLELTHPGAPARAMVVADLIVPKNSPIFIRGEAQNRGPIVPHRFFECLSGPTRQNFKIGSGRLELANAIAARDNPLTARVMVNRIWMHHFGEGFVRTVDDMGVQSEPPSHPELLDYLATRFMEDGWSVKQLHKLIMLSNTYQESSDTNPAYAQKDPANRLMWRGNLRRLDFEAIRDSMLQFTGKIDLAMGGKPVNLTDEPYSNRRSVYGYIDRGNMPELMQQFDFSDPDMTNTKRTTTIVPQQALFFMNSPMSVDVARKVTSRPEFLNATDDAGRVKAIYQVIFQRSPRPEEVRFAADFYNATVTSHPPGAMTRSNTPEAPSKDALRAAKQAERQAANRKMGPKGAIQNTGERVERKPLSVWEEYAQALLFTNELAYVN